MIKRYTTLFFDLDNTLLDFKCSENKAIRKVLSLHNLKSDDATAELYSNINKKWWERFERGEIKREDIFVSRFEELLKEISSSVSAEQMSRDYFKALSEAYDVIPGAEQILKKLKSFGYNICVTTNGVAFTQHNRIEKSGLYKYFDYIFISEEMNHQKPEKEYFDYALSHGPESERTKVLIIGDSQSSDILGGINASIDTCWYNPKYENPIYKSSYTVHTLNEIVDLLCD